MSAEEYRKLTTKVVKAPSGFEFMIKKLSLKATNRIFQLLGLRETTIDTKTLQEDPELRKNLAQVIDIVLTDAVVKPRIVLNVVNPNEELSIVEITYEDGLSLFTEILDFSGLSPEKASERASFR